MTPFEVWEKMTECGFHHIVAVPTGWLCLSYGQEKKRGKHVVNHSVVIPDPDAAHCKGETDLQGVPSNVALSDISWTELGNTIRERGWKVSSGGRDEWGFPSVVISHRAMKIEVINGIWFFSLEGDSGSDKILESSISMEGLLTSPTVLNHIDVFDIRGSE